MKTPICGFIDFDNFRIWGLNRIKLHILLNNSYL